MTTLRKLRLAVVLAAAVPASAALAIAATSLASEVRIENFTFKSETTSIPTGTAVTFKNADDIPHSIVASDGSFHSHALDTDDAFTFTFTTPGTYTYFCGLHPKMQGRIVVTPK